MKALRDSIWFRTLGAVDSQTLEYSDDPPRTADVAVVGSGLIGLATAYYLTEAGLRNVCVIDRGPIVGEASGANAGGLWPCHEMLSLGSLKGLVQASLALFRDLEAQFEFDRSYDGSLELIEDSATLAAGAERASQLRDHGCDAELLAEPGFLERRSAELSAFYAERAATLHRALTAIDGVSADPARGGLFLWARAPVDTSVLLDVAVAEGVAFVPGSVFDPDGAPSSMLRASFATLDDAGLREAAARVGRALQAAQR